MPSRLCCHICCFIPRSHYIRGSLTCKRYSLTHTHWLTFRSLPKQTVCSLHNVPNVLCQAMHKETPGGEFHFGIYNMYCYRSLARAWWGQSPHRGLTLCVCVCVVFYALLCLHITPCRLMFTSRTLNSPIFNIQTIVTDCGMLLQHTQHGKVYTVPNWHTWNTRYFNSKYMFLAILAR